MARSIVYLNVLLYALIAADGCYEGYLILFRWDVPRELIVDALLIRAIFVVPSLVCAIGLARGVQWARRAASSLNAGFGFLILAPFWAFPIGGLLAGLSFSESLVIVPIGAARYLFLAAATILFVMAWALRGRAVRSLFEAHA